MIKLIDILKEITLKEPIGQGSEHIIYPYSKDPNKVIKTFDSDETESINKNQITTFQNHPDIFPIVYKVTDKYAVLEKLNTKKAIDELEKLAQFLKEENNLIAVSDNEESDSESESDESEDEDSELDLGSDDESDCESNYDGKSTNNIKIFYYRLYSQYLKPMYVKLLFVFLLHYVLFFVLL